MEFDYLEDTSEQSEGSEEDVLHPGIARHRLDVEDIENYVPPRKQEENSAAQHAAYRAQKGGRPDTSIVGKYIVNCAAVMKGWSPSGQMTVSIRKAKLPGFYVAHVDLRTFKGVMMLSRDEKALGFFADEDECCDESDSADVDVEEEKVLAPATGSKRKRVASAKNTKAARTLPVKSEKPTHYFLCARWRAEPEDEISFRPLKGAITFADDLMTFTGTLGNDYLGEDEPWSGRKISATPKMWASMGRWEDYSQEVWEARCSSRWH